MIKLFVLSILTGTVLACSSNYNNIAEQDIKDLQIQIDEQKAIEDIRVLFADYGRSLDQRDYQWFASLYADDAVYVTGLAGTEFHGPDAIAQQLESVISQNATGANLHVFANDKISVDMIKGFATATSRGAFYVQDEQGSPVPLIFATYVDTLVLTDKGWKFKRREIVGDIPGPANESK